jgi:DNA repair protein RadA/Sms
LEVAKKNSCAIMIIGHVTKDGAVAGPKTLEHLVDTVLYFEGDPDRDLRILRSVKNRFGSTNEIGVFEMVETGLQEVSDPSLAVTTAHEAHPGSIIACAIEGTRPLLIEIQALVHKTAFGYPERRASGFDTNRLKLLLAVMESRAGLALVAYDVHVNVVGGIKLKEPAMDLPVALALASAFKDKTLPRTIAAFGEIDLSGNIRPVHHTQKRIDECLRLGMKKIILPFEEKWKQPEVVKVKNIAELVKHAV